MAKNEASYRSKLPALRDWLIAIARDKQKVTYGDMMEAFGIDRFSLRHAMDYLGHEAESNGEPIITALIVRKESQVCSEGLRKEFGVTDDEAERVKLYEYWSNPDVQQIRPRITEEASLELRSVRFASVEVRPQQARFRREVFLAFGGRCAISGCEIVSALDAAHKHGCNWRLGRNNVSDGILLRKDLHALYDARLISIAENGRFIFDNSVVGHYRTYINSEPNGECEPHLFYSSAPVRKA